MPCKSCGKDSGKFHEGSCPECLVERVRELEIANASLIGAIDSAIIETRRLQVIGGELEASCAVMRDALEKAKDALNAPTHEANDYNCQDWPPEAGCRGCDGDELREQAVKQIESTLSTTAGKELLERVEDAKARICELEAALVDIEKHCGWLCDDIRERDKVLCHELSIRYIIAQVHPQYARAAVDGDGKREEG